MRNQKDIWAGRVQSQRPPETSSSSDNPQKIHPKVNANAALNIIAKLEGKCSRIETSFNKALTSLHELEQYMRRQNLLIYGLDDIAFDKHDFAFVQYICNKLNALLPNLSFGEILPNDINDAHPLFAKPGSKVVVIVQFNKRWIRNELLRRK